jgi:hypothetical protein
MIHKSQTCRLAFVFVVKLVFLNLSSPALLGPFSLYLYFIAKNGTVT